MVMAFPIAVVAGGAGARPRGVSAAVLFTILFHIVLGWYVVSRFMFVPSIDTDDGTVIIVEPPARPLPPPPPPPMPTVTHDDVQPHSLPTRHEVKFPQPVDTVEPSPPSPPAAPGPVGPIGPAVSAPTAPPVAPSPTYRVQPTFPDRAVEDGVSGTVELQLTIGAGGLVEDAQIMEEKPVRYGFGAAALKAVHQWKFATAAPGTYRITVKFNLSD